MQRLQLLAFALCGAVSVAACGSDEGPGPEAAGTGAAASGGNTPGLVPPAAGTGGVGGAKPDAGSAATPAAGSGGAGGSSSMSGGRAGAGGRGGRGGRGNAGRGAAGSGGVPAAGSGSAGRAGSSVAGSGGAAAEGCVENLSCQLDPPASTGDIHQDCVDRINQFRTQCACLPALARWTEGEACANQQSEYDSVEGRSAHAGFGAGICKGGSAQNECPGWPSTTRIVSGCLQQMWNEGPPPTNPCNGDCFQEYGHFINMTNTRFSKVACGFHTREDGEIWSVQNFSQ